MWTGGNGKHSQLLGEKNVCLQFYKIYSQQVRLNQDWVSFCVFFFFSFNSIISLEMKELSRKQWMSLCQIWQSRAEVKQEVKLKGWSRDIITSNPEKSAKPCLSVWRVRASGLILGRWDNAKSCCAAGKSAVSRERTHEKAYGPYGVESSTPEIQRLGNVSQFRVPKNYLPFHSQSLLQCYPRLCHEVPKHTHAVPLDVGLLCICH